MKNLIKSGNCFIPRLLFLFSLLLTTAQCFATNYIDSDLSNNAGTNKNWQSSFWFFVCVTLLIAVAIIGYRKRFIKIRKDYEPEHRDI